MIMNSNLRRGITPSRARDIPNFTPPPHTPDRLRRCGRRCTSVRARVQALAE